MFKFLTKECHDIHTHTKKKNKRKFCHKMTLMVFSFFSITFKMMTMMDKVYIQALAHANNDNDVGFVCLCFYTQTNPSPRFRIRNRFFFLHFFVVFFS